MSNSSILSLHTFGRERSEPPQGLSAPQGGVSPATNEHWHESRHTGSEAGLPDDFDHLIRSIGEW